MTWWPGWNSVESAGFWSHFWFWIGMVSLFVVGVSELISHRYGLRKAELINDKVISLAATPNNETQARPNIPERRITSSPMQPIAEPPKVLTAEQQKTLIAALTPFRSQKVHVEALVGSDDGLASDFVEIFRAAGWDVDSTSPSKVVLSTRLFGLQPTINRASTAPPAFVALVDTLATLGLGPQTGFADEQTPVGVINLKIGVR